MAEWDVVSTAPVEAPKADPWAVVSHVPVAPPPGYEDNPATGYHYRPNTLADNPITRSPIWGAADIAASGVSKLAGKIGGGIAGLGTMATNALGLTDTAPADVVGTVKDAVGTEASSPGAADVQNSLKVATTPVRAVTEPAGAFLDRQVNKLPDGARTVVQGAEEAIPDIAAVLPIGALGRGARAAEPAAAVEGAAKPVVGTGEQAVQTGRAAGFKFTPGAVESRNPAAAVAGDVPQSFAVNANDRRAINLHNNAQAVKLAGEQIGVKDATTLSKKNFDDARQPHFDTYKATGDALGTGLKGSDAFTSTLEAQLADVTPQGALKSTIVPQVKQILARAQSGNMSGPQMVKDISWLRANGGRSVANTIENEVETQLGANSPQLGAFREARTGLAQIHQLQQAAPGGIINARALADFDRKNPGVLTGHLKTIAQSAAAAPQDFILPSGVQPGSSPLSKPTWAGAAKAVAGKVAKFVAPSKFDVQSDAFQNRFGREASPTEATYFKDLGKRPAAPSAGFELQPSPGKAFSPNQRDMGPLSEGPGPREQLNLIPPEGSVFEPHQLGMQVAQGPGPREMLQLQPADGQVGVNPVQLGMEVAQGRPLPDQRLGLQQTPAGLEPHQPSLLGHEGTPEGGSRKPKPKPKKAKKDDTD